MEFDPLWLLLAAPLLFAGGWLAARWDLRQLRQERTESPRAYFVGLNLLLNEQQDEAIDAFVEAVQNDPDTAELHFALGNLFRRRGEFERAVRVHQHLLDRADLTSDQRLRAQLALAQDFLAAGLFDRAETAYKALLGTRFDQEASLALLNVHERTRDWSAALTAAAHLQSLGAGSFTQRMAHYHCELAAASQDRESVDAALGEALRVAPLAPRPRVALVEHALAQGRTDAALDAAEDLQRTTPDFLGLVAAALADQVRAQGQAAQLSRLRQMLADAGPLGSSADVALASLSLAPEADSGAALAAALSQRADLRLARRWVAQATTSSMPGSAAALAAIDAALKPLDRYRCAACGFEASRHFWHCPGCHSWDSFPPRRLVEDVR